MTTSKKPDNEEFIVRMRCRKGRQIPPVFGPWRELGRFLVLRDALESAQGASKFHAGREVSVWLKKSVIHVFNPEGGAIEQAVQKKEKGQPKGPKGEKPGSRGGRRPKRH